MGNFNRDNRGGGRSFGRRDFGSRDFNRGGGRSGDNRMFKAICSECGKECEVPFRPTNGKPVYCSECFEKKGGRRSDSSRPQRPDFRSQSLDQNKSQFDALNIKLDRILKLLEPKVDSKIVSTPIVTKEEKKRKPLEIKEVVAKVAVKKEANKIKVVKAKKVTAKKKK